MGLELRKKVRAAIVGQLASLLQNLYLSYRNLIYRNPMVCRGNNHPSKLCHKQDLQSRKPNESDRTHKFNKHLTIDTSCVLEIDNN